ncbi:RAD52 DNA repair protein [Aspergillus heteromorphus CBS 117.55]|uniref:RAD52 homolog n=1 Tax=Aspergillus heteromorphus CBS 117.55 TaxID=1448321 RepID=A0A317WJJ3_9EURO|nr:RAD52 DNA repair protein [Aspergillus heteromorphus CBS 117.55]PWY86225.1 RAD52 DNA repair protein [Aspergillus heteromorphus CBS 117.55]
MPAVGDQHRGSPATIMMQTSAAAMSANPFDEPQKRISSFTAQEIATLQARLDKKLGPEYISSRPGAAGQRVHYLPADKCINLANEVFGFNGWSSSIQNITVDFVEENPNTGKVNLGLSVVVRVTLKDGTYHEDIGYGHMENAKGKAAAFEKAKKEGTTDGLKRALRNFGNVLGNCVYDKDYVAKVTKVKAMPAKWDVDELHRHQDYAPIKKEPVKPKPSPEDDNLPPRPAEIGRSSNGDDPMAFDGDGEFGSDLFDEADFGDGGAGNPDEIVLGPETHRMQQPPTPLNGANAHRRPFDHNARPNPAMVTPSKPERPFNAAPAARHIPAPQAFHNRPAAPDQYAPQRQSAPPQSLQPNNRMIPPAQQNTFGAQVPIKREQGAPPTTMNIDPKPQDTLPSGTPSASFFSARAVDLLRDNPNGMPTNAPAFDPHAESPSIRKTAGIDHNKSVPISRPMLTGTGASPAPNNTRDYINPSQDMHRKIGAPGGAGVGSPMTRGPSTSSYRPLTRPNIDPRAGAGAAAAGAAAGAAVPGAAHRAPQAMPQNINGKRPPLSDVTNASNPGGSGPAPVGVVNDPKRPRMNQGIPGPPQQPPL